jgi:hypothetical protein
MDAHDYARLASLVAGERSAVATALARFRTHHLGNDWRGRSRAQAEAAHQSAIEATVRSLGALDDTEREALRLWRAALSATHPLGG